MQLHVIYMWTTMQQLDARCHVFSSVQEGWQAGGLHAAYMKLSVGLEAELACSQLQPARLERDQACHLL